MIDNYHKPISHIHTKDLHRPVMADVGKSWEKFSDAVIKGGFTVPGDGDIDVDRIIRSVNSYQYASWFVVEAGQDSYQNPPLERAQPGQQTRIRILIDTGYQIDV